MTWQLDVEIGDGGGVDLPDAVAVDQMPDGDQHTLGIDRVVGREDEAPRRLAQAEGLRNDTDRPHLCWFWMPTASDVATADPDDRQRCAVMGR